MNLPTSSKIININYIESHEQFKKKMSRLSFLTTFIIDSRH
jgi:hypothetical protein